MYQVTTATKKLQKLNKRIRGVAGGSSASKTISILLILINYAQELEKGKPKHSGELISVVSKTLPHLKKGAIRDFKNIMKTHRYWKADRWNETDKIYTFETDVQLEFFSADQSDKVHGPRRDVLFVNEANNISFETFNQLEVRTKKIIWCDWNPTFEFWFYTDILGKWDNVDFVILTYKDNECLDPAIVRSIESRRTNKNWWQVYGLGQLGVAEGRIYKDWAAIPSIPHEARLERYGVDFGYTNDPTAIVAVYRHNGGYILDEIMFKKGLSNKQIADILLNQPQALVVADSAEPKSIDELSSYGLSVIPSVKGQGSVSQGIQLVQQQRISYTERSLNIEKEYRNFFWQTDKEGKIINTPDVGWDHSMDAIRYAIKSLEVSPDDDLSEIPDDTIMFNGIY